MNGKQLRNSILQWGISGRLVPQCPTDEPASELLKRINPKAAPLNPDDAPFPIPNSWCWCRLGDIGNIVTGSTPSKSIKDYYNGDIPFFKPTDLEQGINVCEASDHLSEKGYKQARQLPPNSVLVTCIGATIGKTGLTSVAGTCNQQINAIVPNNVVLPLYVYFACVSDCIQTKIKTNASATTLPILNKGNFARLPFPLPPLAEQERIVRKVEELLPLVERYDKAQTELDRLNASLKGKLRASVLQEAIAGRLVPQDPADEPASLLLKRINPKAAPLAPDDAPFTIPDNWCWCRIGDIFDHNTGKALNKSVDTEGHLLPYLTTSNVYWDKFDLTEVRKMYFKDSEIEKCTVRKGDLLVCEGGDVGRSAIWDYDETICIQNHLHRLRTKGEVADHRFYLYVLMLYKERQLIKGKGIGLMGLSSRALDNLLIPLPPLAEQERIVGKVEELFAVLDALSPSTH